MLLPAILAELVSDSVDSQEPEYMEWKGKLVLLVEDDDDVRQVVRELLIKMGFNVIESSTAEEAKALIAVLDDVYAFVSDIRLDGETNGYDLADMFKFTHPMSRVVLMTGYAFDENSGRAGKSYYKVLQKSFYIKQLQRFLEMDYE